jgi:hypothetical protein
MYVASSLILYYPIETLTSTFSIICLCYQVPTRIGADLRHQGSYDEVGLPILLRYVYRVLMPEIPLALKDLFVFSFSQLLHERSHETLGTKMLSHEYCFFRPVL